MRLRLRTSLTRASSFHSKPAHAPIQVRAVRVETARSVGDAATRVHYCILDQALLVRIETLGERKVIETVVLSAVRRRENAGDVFEVPISDATVVTLYLFPHVMLKLRERLKSELKPGTRVVSHEFTMGDWEPEVTERVRNARVHLWII